MNLALALEFLLVCLIAVAYRQSWLAECARADRFRDQTNDYMVENTALRRELAESKNHARYFESLSEWQAEHHRVPTDEERDLLWERIRAKLDGAKLLSDENRRLFRYDVPDRRDDVEADHADAIYEDTCRFFGALPLPRPAAKLPESFSYYTIEGLVRASGGKLP